MKPSNNWLCRGSCFLLHSREQPSPEGLNNIKKSAVSRGENQKNQKKTGQKSCKYGEIIKKPYFFVWGKARQRATQATPHPTASRIRGFTRGKSADAGRGREIQMRNWDAERGGGGGEITRNLITHQPINISKIAITFLLLIALTKCAFWHHWQAKTCIQ